MPANPPLDQPVIVSQRAREAAELKRCPLCGGTELSHGYVAGGGHEWGTAGCEACDLQVTKATESDAIAAWNTRFEAPLVEEIERLDAQVTWLSAVMSEIVERGVTVELEKIARDALEEVKRTALAKGEDRG